MRKLYQAFRNLEPVQRYHLYKSEKQSTFYEANRKEVLNHYRYLLQNVPALYQRRLQQRSVYIEICYLFHESRVLNSIYETRSRSEHLRQLVEEIKSGDYGNLGTYLPARQGQILYIKAYMHYFNHRFDK